MATFMTNNEWAQQKDHDYFIGFNVTCLAASAITTGWYFFYNNGSIAYNIWFDKDGDGITDDPGAKGTGVAVDISSATTATTVATALQTAIDGLAGSSAESLDAVVTITNASNEKNSNLTDYNTTFTIAKLGYAKDNDSPSANALTLYRRRMYANMNKYIPGEPNTSTYADTFLGIEYRGIEFIIDEEQGRTVEEGRTLYVPRDFIGPGDRMALGGMGSSFGRGIGS